MDVTAYEFDNGLTTGIAEWFKNNTYFNGAFKEVYDYCRIDNIQGQFTSISVYLLPSNTRAKPGKITGKVKIATSFSIGKQRENKFKEIRQVMNMIRGQLLTNPIYLQNYLSINWVPGLQWIQSQNDIDYTTVEAALLRGDGSTMIPIVLDYQIDILLNQRAIWAAGNDYYSPIDPIYHTIEHTEVEIELDHYKK